MIKDLYPLTSWQLQLLKQAQNATYKKLPKPWTYHSGVSAAGILAGGWTTENEFVLISSDGYSLINPITGICKFFVISNSVWSNLDEDTLEFTLPSTEETISIFGVYGGDGLHVIDDWEVEIIHPMWPNAMVVMYQNSLLEWETVYPLQLQMIDVSNWVKCGFSPSKNILAVVGYAGIDFFGKVSLPSINVKRIF